MDCEKNEKILFGLNNYMEIIDDIITDLKLFDYAFDIKLILTEALTNAFKCGNNGDSSKIIYLSYCCKNNCLQFEIKDCGEKQVEIHIPEEIDTEDVLNTSGRGLFLINSFANKVYFSNNTLIIQKHLN